MQANLAKRMFDIFGFAGLCEKLVIPILATSWFQKYVSNARLSSASHRRAVTIKQSRRCTSNHWITIATDILETSPNIQVRKERAQ